MNISNIRNRNNLYKQSPNYGNSSHPSTSNYYSNNTRGPIPASWKRPSNVDNTIKQAVSQAQLNQNYNENFFSGPSPSE